MIIRHLRDDDDLQSWLVFWAWAVVFLGVIALEVWRVFWQ